VYLPTPLGESWSSSVCELLVEDRTNRTRIDGLVFTGPGHYVLHAASERTGTDGAELLRSIVGNLLVRKGANWTTSILGEYLRLYDDSTGIFSLVWDRLTSQFVSHAAVFHSMAHPWCGLLAHVRTADQYKGLGLGSLVTEQVTAAAFAHSLKLVALATDDKVHRQDLGERAAHSMYARLGYAMLGELQLADTIDRLMVVSAPIFRATQSAKQQNGGRYPAKSTETLVQTQAEFVHETRERFHSCSDATIESVGAGDLANLFLLLNLCPAQDFRLKLSSWRVHHGPEFEREFVTTHRNAIVDKDRLHDASQILRDTDGAILAICAAQQIEPFTLQTYVIDFYCLPHFLASSSQRIRELVQQAINRIAASSARPRPCRLSFSGIDAEKIAVFESLGFTRTRATTQYLGSQSQVAFEAVEYSMSLA
jgi:GNAT superfamily N-acetyltransferase